MVTWETLALRDGRISTSVQPQTATTILASRSFGLLGRRVAPGVPASHEQRGRAVEVGVSATTLFVRRRPPPEPGQPHRNALPRGLPGSAIVRVEPCSRYDLPKHNSVPGTPR